ncbi:MAG TPA: hypothetical protein VLX12_11930 [Syntrophorhabdales bacterium]|nr:hypothetical protein [Syntrophorhabdales bacterium]
MQPAKNFEALALQGVMITYNCYLGRETFEVGSMSYFLSTASTMTP